MATINDDGTVTVQSGDTLSAIADLLGVSLSELLGANPEETTPDAIDPGQVINVPGSSSTETETESETEEVDAGGGVSVSEQDPADALDLDTSGVGTGDLTILTGEQMEWFFDSSTGLWYVGYGLPNSESQLVFEATAEQMNALFGLGFRPSSYQETSLNDLLSGDGIVFGGNVSEMEGTGSFEAEVARITALALDEGVLPEWAEGDAAAMDIIFIAQAESKSSEWIIEQLSQLDSFGERFPNIGKLEALGLSTVEAVTAFLELESGVKALANDPSDVTPEVMGDILDQGHSLTDIQFVFQSFQTLEDNETYFDAFNGILEENGLAPLSVDQQLEFLQGNATEDLYEIWESSSFLAAADVAGVGDVFFAEDAINAALNTPGIVSFEGALQGLQQASQLLLSLRTEVDLGKFGLDSDDLIDMSLGLAPRSGISQADLQQTISRAVQEANAFITRPAANPFFNFTQQGVPQAASLTNARQTS